MPALAESYAFCRSVARKRAKNFYYSFVLLPREQSDAMCAIYAFMRYCDDLSDEPGATRAAIERWRAEMEEALEGRFSSHPVWPAFHHTVRRFGIPHQYFREMVDGVLSDLEPRRFETFDELYRYCFQVASVVGLCTIHVFGFDSPDAVILAEKCGIAFQLTNILRDVAEDAARERVYLPAEDLRRFSVDPRAFRNGLPGGAVRSLLAFEAERARAYYRESQPLVGMIHQRSRPALRALIGIYSHLLTRISEKEFDVFTERVALSTAEKCWIVLRAWMGG